jgi:rRNA maturation protein Rpf1
MEFYREIQNFQLKNPNEDISKLIDKDRPQVCMDPEVSRVYQDICSSCFNQDIIQNLQFTLNNLDYCISFERLIYAIVSIYHQIKAVFAEIEKFLSDEKYYLVKISEKIVTDTIDGLEKEY